MTQARQWIIFFLKLAFSIGVLIVCFVILDVSKLPQVLVGVDPFWLFNAFLLTILGTIVLPAMITRRALEIDRIRLSTRELININFTNRFYVLVLPRAVSVGIRWLRYRKGGDGHDALALMVFERIVQLFAMMLVGAIALIAEISTLGNVAYGFLILVLGVLVVFGIALLPFIFPRTATILIALSKHVERLAPGFISRRVNKIVDAVQAFNGLKYSTGGAILVLSLFSYGLFILAPYLIVLAMELDVTFVALAWVRPIVFSLTLLPFTVGGLGVREAGFIGLLSTYGVAYHEAMALSLTLFAIQGAIGFIGACLEFWRYVSKNFYAKSS